MVFRVFIFIILLFRINGKNGHLNDFRHYYGNFLKVLFWKLLDYSYVQSSFSAIMRHIDNSSLKYPLQLKILWINIRVNSFIKTWESIVKWKSKKLPRKLWVAQKLSLQFLFTVLIIICHFTDLEVYTVFLYISLIKTTKTLLWLSVLLFFEDWQPQNVVTMFLLFTNISYLLEVKITPDITNSLWFLHAV